MEWAFNYRQGPGKTAVIQLCRAEDVCYVFQVAGLKRLPAALVKLLDHSKVCLHGVNIKKYVLLIVFSSVFPTVMTTLGYDNFSDLRKLGRDFHEVCVRGMMERCCDLGVWYNRLHNSTGTWSMERLVAKIVRDIVYQTFVTNLEVVAASNPRSIYTRKYNILKKNQFSAVFKSTRTSESEPVHGIHMGCRRNNSCTLPSMFM